MEETLQPQPNTGIGGKTIRYLQMRLLIKGVEFIQKRFFLSFNSEYSEKRLQEKLRICPFSGSREEKMAYAEKLEEELRENIIKQINLRHAKWFNPTFIITKLHEKRKQILEANSLNLEIQTSNFIMNGTVHVKYLIRKGNQAIDLDLKSVFQNLKVYPPYRPYLVFQTMGKVYQYREMPFGTQHFPIFFAQALAMGLTKIRRESDKRIHYYLDDLLFLHCNQQ
ncbi:MAG: hypothetical protein EZS28_026627 [Streblomastix strix]|uniref:Reverse transcriptase domain-containing protein n=1 Tax=Streblomastix strix TaxID=222440 RepID=A0A5J4V4K3_9EUKA|nr:MAG: hypothetical protein EZS28_026627 [Streblomastix strix]